MVAIYSSSLIPIIFNSSDTLILDTSCGVIAKFPYCKEINFDAHGDVVWTNDGVSLTVYHYTNRLKEVFKDIVPTINIKRVCVYPHPYRVRAESYRGLVRPVWGVGPNCHLQR